MFVSHFFAKTFELFFCFVIITATHVTIVFEKIKNESCVCRRPSEVLKTFLSSKSHCLKITENVAFEIFWFRHFSLFFVLIKLTCLVILFDHKINLYINHFCIFHKLFFKLQKWATFARQNEIFSAIFNHSAFLNSLWFRCVEIHTNKDRKLLSTWD